MFRRPDQFSHTTIELAGFRGEYDALQRVLPTITAHVVETKALAMTGKENAKQLTAESKLNTDFDFFSMLHQLGRRAARRFLDAHFDDIGRRSTVDLRAEVTAERA